jgi:actin-related protein 5
MLQKGGVEAEAKTKWWQLPWVPPPEKEQPSEEELARRAAIKEKQGQRLREMAFAKRSSKIADLETEIEGLEYLLQELDDAEDAKAEASLLGPSSFGSREEVQAALAKATMSLRKAKGEPVDIKKVEDDIPMSEKYPLLEVPNSLLTPEQLKEKKKQQFLKITTEGRIRAKQKRQEEDLQREREQQLEEERRLANPELYLEELRVRQAEVSARVDQSKRQKIGMASAGAVTSLTSGVSGRGERLSAVQKERMKLLTTAAFDRGKDEDTFGMNDEDWELYKRVGKDTDGDDEDDEDEAELARINIRLKELDPSFMPSTGLIQGAQTVIPSVQQRPLTAEDFRIPLGVERFRAPEIVLQPSMMGLDQAGLGEMLALALMRLPQHYRERVMKGSVLLTGGNSLFEGLDMRLLAELRMTRPLGATIKVVRAADPKLDAWRGASVFASSSSFQKSALSKADFEERGPDWLRHHNLKYSGGSLSNSFLTDNT